MPQVNAWMKLLAQVQDGPFKPYIVRKMKEDT
jgi:hypothetical protein